jgi:hypothetical protein
MSHRGINLKCRTCGCTSDTPCILMRAGAEIGCCSWVSEGGATAPLCSACVPGSEAAGLQLALPGLGRQLGLPGLKVSPSATWARFRRAHSADAFQKKERA